MDNPRDVDAAVAHKAFTEGELILGSIALYLVLVATACLAIGRPSSAGELGDVLGGAAQPVFLFWLIREFRLQREEFVAQREFQVGRVIAEREREIARRSELRARFTLFWSGTPPAPRTLRLNLRSTYARLMGARLVNPQGGEEGAIHFRRTTIGDIEPNPNPKPVEMYWDGDPAPAVIGIVGRDIEDHELTYWFHVIPEWNEERGQPWVTNCKVVPLEPPHDEFGA